MGLTNKIRKELEHHHLHKTTLKEIGIIIYDEHKHPCGYLRNSYTNNNHTVLGGNCSLKPNYACINGFHKVGTSGCSIEEDYWKIDKFANQKNLGEWS